MEWRSSRPGKMGLILSAIGSPFERKNLRLMNRIANMAVFLWFGLSYPFTCMLFTCSRTSFPGDLVRIPMIDEGKNEYR